MKGLLPIAVITFAFVCSAVHLQVPVGTPAVVSLDIHRHAVASHELERRQGVSMPLAKQKTGRYYTAELSVGTPPVTINVDLDTGSSDFWVNHPKSSLCDDGQPDGGCPDGSYDANSSSTSVYLNSFLNIHYGDRTFGIGDFVSETVVFGGTTMNNVTMGVGYRSTSRVNMLGIGHMSLEGQVTHGTAAPYNNVPMQLYASGAIKSPAYSLYLNDIQASTGSILFGGVDTDKYSGSLQTVPILPNKKGVYNRMTVALSAVTTTQSGRVTNVNTSDIVGELFLLDSGTEVSVLPPILAHDIYRQVGVVFSAEHGRAFIPCASAEKDMTIDFNFSGKVIRVPLREFIIPMYKSMRTDPDLRALRRGFCLFTIVKRGNRYILGNDFLRSAYVVFDLENNEIALAQTVFDSTSSNILEIVPGRNGIPGSTDASITNQSPDKQPHG